MNIDPSLLRRAAEAATHGQAHPAGALYVVATPIGNLADLTLRAIHVLSLADAVACEDTRVSAGLLRHLDLHKPLIALHEHNEAQASDEVLALLAAGKAVALVSDAGTPAISDPGAKLVARAHRQGVRVIPLPGASSIVAALSAAGDEQGQGFVFVGFVAAKGTQRDEALRAACEDPRTQVLLEAPHRIEALVATLAQLAPERRVTLARELSKQFETIHTDRAQALLPWIEDDPNRRRGEFVIVLHAMAVPPAGSDELPAQANQTLTVLLRELPLKQAVQLAAEISGASRNALYARALELKGSGS